MSLPQAAEVGHEHHHEENNPGTELNLFNCIKSGLNEDKVVHLATAHHLLITN